MSSQLGRNIRISIFGESHGDGVGCVVEGLPCGLKVDRAHLEKRMVERRPGGSALATARNESDSVTFLSGVLENTLTGAPVTIWIQNKDTRSKDYKKLESLFRPSHADYTAHVKYEGFNDPRGGGHFSARLTAPLVAVGAICEQLLNAHQIQVKTQLVAVGSERIEPSYDEEVILDPVLAAAIEKARFEANSIGGEVLTEITGVPVGIGAPIFDSVESRLSQGIFGIPGVKGISFGAGFDFIKMSGAEANDVFYRDAEGVKTRTNFSGGVNGGISNGMPIVFQCVFRPTSSIGLPQETLNFSNNKIENLVVTGRHDPCIALRGVPVVRAMSSMIILDLLMDFKGFEIKL